MEWVLNYLWREIRSPDKHHASAALYRLDRHRLQSILDEEQDFFEIAAFVLQMPTHQSLELAIASTNWTFKFWALHHSAIHAASGGNSYPMEWQILLSQSIKVPDEWIRWLAVLNEYPGRYPQLQQVLGATLASASGEALEAYVSSISENSDSGLAEIATALTVFREQARVRDRKRLWTIAFKRWENWNFGCKENTESLLQVKKGPFDFMVVGYLTECMESQVRSEWIAKLQLRATAIERNWYPNITDAKTERFKIISTYQLIAHSEAVANGEPDWLQGTSLYKPPWEDGSLFRSLKYDGKIGKSTFFSK